MYVLLLSPSTCLRNKCVSCSSPSFVLQNIIWSGILLYNFPLPEPALLPFDGRLQLQVLCG